MLECGAQLGRAPRGRSPQITLQRGREGAVYRLRDAWSWAGVRRQGREASQLPGYITGGGGLSHTERRWNFPALPGTAI